MSKPQFSVIIPVYNRPQEVREILSSLASQSFKNFEVIVVEDGSSVRCEEVVDVFRDQLKLSYFFKPNSGPGPAVILDLIKLKEIISSFLIRIALSLLIIFRT